MRMIITMLLYVTYSIICYATVNIIIRYLLYSIYKKKKLMFTYINHLKCDLPRYIKNIYISTVCSYCR